VNGHCTSDRFCVRVDTNDPAHGIRKQLSLTRAIHDPDFQAPRQCDIDRKHAQHGNFHCNNMRQPRPIVVFLMLQLKTNELDCDACYRYLAHPSSLPKGLPMSTRVAHWGALSPANNRYLTFPNWPQPINWIVIPSHSRSFLLRIVHILFRHSLLSVSCIIPDLQDQLRI